MNEIPIKWTFQTCNGSKAPLWCGIIILQQPGVRMYLEIFSPSPFPPLPSCVHVVFWHEKRRVGGALHCGSILRLNCSVFFLNSLVSSALANSAVSVCLCTLWNFYSSVKIPLLNKYCTCSSAVGRIIFSYKLGAWCWCCNKAWGSNPAQTEGRVFSRAWQNLLAAHSLLHDLWVVCQTLCLHLSPELSLLSWIASVKRFAMCFYTKIDKAKWHICVSETIYSNPDTLKDRKLRMRGEIDLCTAEWEWGISSHWNLRTVQAN